MKSNYDEQGVATYEFESEDERDDFFIDQMRKLWMKYLQEMGDLMVQKDKSIVRNDTVSK